MSKHTPGPWVVGNVDPLNFGVQRGWGTEPIGFVYGPSFPEHSEVGQRALANARLIAAAPELLEALRDLVDAMTGRLDGETIALHNALIVLAKAEGK